MRRLKQLLFTGILALWLPVTTLGVLGIQAMSGAGRQADGGPAPELPAAGAGPRQTALTEHGPPPDRPPTSPAVDPGFDVPERPPQIGGAADETLCGGPPVMTILVVGSDARQDSYLYGLADAIRIVRVDFTEPEIAVLALPRDLWVEIPGISDHYGISHGKLNQAFLYGGAGMGYFDGPGAGLGLLASTLEANFGLQVDHAAAIHMTRFTALIDALGGLDLILPHDIDGRASRRDAEAQFFAAGPHHLSGEAALRLARLRTNYDDLRRIEHQNLLIAALIDRLLSPAILPALPEVAEALFEGVMTDFSLGELAPLLCLATQINPDNLRLFAIPDALLEPGRVYSPHLRGRVSVLTGDMEAVREWVAAFQAGN